MVLDTGFHKCTAEFAGKQGTYSDPLSLPKRKHLMTDIGRMSRLYNVRISPPQPLRQDTIHALAVMNYLAGNLEQEKGVRDRFFRAHWEEKVDIGSLDQIATLAGLSTQTLKEITGPAHLESLISLTKQYYNEFDVFGVPTFVSERGLHFGLDRLDLLLSDLFELQLD